MIQSKISILPYNTFRIKIVPPLSEGVENYTIPMLKVLRLKSSYELLGFINKRQ